MANRPHVWRGPKDLVQQKLRWVFTAELDELMVPFEGPLSVALAKKPKAGDQLRGFTDGGLLVQRVEVEEGDGDTARLLVTLGATKAADESLTFDPLGEPIFEVDFSVETRAIERHPRCGILKPDRGDHPKLQKPVTWDEWEHIRTEDYDNSGVAPGGAPKWTLATYKRLKEKGVEHYHFTYPIIRRTLYYLRDPGGVGANCCTVQDAPYGAPTHAGGMSLDYLLLSDKMRKEGRLRTRETEWHGGHEISDDIYA